MAYVRLKLLIMLYFIDKSGFLEITNFAFAMQRSGVRPSSTPPIFYEHLRRLSAFLFLAPDFSETGN